MVRRSEERSRTRSDTSRSPYARRWSCRTRSRTSGPIRLGSPWPRPGSAQGLQHHYEGSQRVAVTGDQGLDARRYRLDGFDLEGDDPVDRMPEDFAFGKRPIRSFTDLRAKGFVL